MREYTSASLLPHPHPQERVLCVTVPIRGEVFESAGEVYLALVGRYMQQPIKGDVVMPRVAGYVARIYNSKKSPTARMGSGGLMYQTHITHKTDF